MRNEMVCVWPTIPKSGGGSEHNPPVALVAVSGYQGVNGCGKSKRSCVSQYIVHSPVGDENDSCNTVLGNVRERG